jgi:predicted alpha/beta superfamily hydrolase
MTIIKKGKQTMSEFRTVTEWAVEGQPTGKAGEHGASQRSYPPVTIEGTELRHITSNIVGQDYLLKIMLPDGYTESDKAYPVLYLLDGDHAFAMATDIVQYLYYGGHVSELIIVSPAYGSKDTPEYGGTNMRNRDMVPFPLPGSSSEAGAERYLRFFREELIPYVESHLRVDPSDRTIWGYSLGGRFALYALFQEPELFQRYIVVDGFRDNFFEVESAYAEKRSDLPVKLFLSAGLPDDACFRFAETLRRRNYTGLELGVVRLSSTEHFMVGADGLTRGLESVFNKSESS